MAGRFVDFFFMASVSRWVGPHPCGFRAPHLRVHRSSSEAAEASAQKKKPRPSSRSKPGGVVPATIVAGILAAGKFRRPGVHPPEVLGATEGVLEWLFAEHAKRGAHYV